MSDELVQRLREWHEDDEDLSLMRDAADEIERQAREIERLRAEVAEYRGLAAATYQAAGAHDWPVVWLEALSNAASGRAFSTKELLPMETPDHLARAEKAESALAALRKRVEEAPSVKVVDDTWESDGEGIATVLGPADALYSLEGRRVALVVLGEG